jgi:hypothetical protein
MGVQKKALKNRLAHKNQACNEFDQAPATCRFGLQRLRRAHRREVQTGPRHHDHAPPPRPRLRGNFVKGGCWEILLVF